MVFRVFAILAALVFCYQNQAHAQQSANYADDIGYVQLVRLADKSPIVAQVRVKKAITVPAERAPGLEAGKARIYIEAEVLKLLAGRSGLSESIRYLVDLPLNDRGKAPKIKKNIYIIFAKPGSGTGEIQLTDPLSQIEWNAQRESRTRSIIRELLAVDAPPVITGVREIFHVAGNLRGEGETQVFLDTKNNDPVSISIIRRPGIKPVWAVSLTEIVDAAAARPSPGTLLWYRLACGLPRKVPAKALYSNSSGDNAVARKDYALVLNDLGKCE